ncbi:MAG: hypothetical protein K9N07_09355 [Candidatus Cloacimonetes bacterium]|nr:hypothetical protein [Candidatus Cloacimonadota bacterium]
MKKYLFLGLIYFLAVVIQAQIINGDILSVDGKKILKVWGTHYERGYAAGYFMGDKIKSLSENYFIGTFFGGNAYLYENTKEYFLEFFEIEPKYHAETEGMIDGMIEADIVLFSNTLDRDIDENDILLANAIVDLSALRGLGVNYDFGCSSLSSWGDNTAGDLELQGDLVITRNMDWTLHPELLENHLLVVHFPSESNEVNWLSFTFPGFIGCLSGINENELSAFMNMGNRNDHTNNYTYHPILLSIRNGIEVFDYNGDYEITPDDILAAVEDNFQLSGSIIHAASNEGGLIIECNNQYGVVSRDDNDNTMLPLEHLAATNHFRELYPPVSCYRYENISDSLSVNPYITIERSWNLMAAAAGVSTNLHTIQYVPSLQLIKWSTADLGSPAYQNEPTTFDLDDLFTSNASSDQHYIQQNSFLSATPNPFNTFTNLAFTLPRTSDVRLTVYNVKGHKITVLINNVLYPGKHNVLWDGTDRNGNKVASGIYLSSISPVL